MSRNLLSGTRSTQGYSQDRSCPSVRLRSSIQATRVAVQAHPWGSVGLSAYQSAVENYLERAPPMAIPRKKLGTTLPKATYVS